MWKTQKNIKTGEPEISISGFEQGIADSPYVGLADIRNINIISAPKQGAVAFSTVGCTLPPTGYTATGFSADDTTDVFTVATTAGFYTGMALTIVTVSSPTASGGVTAGYTYYVGNITPTTFKLYKSIDVGLPRNILLDITGTFTVPTFGTPSDSVSGPSGTFSGSSGLNFKETFVMTTDGYVWRLSFGAETHVGGTVPANSLQFLGNVDHSTAGGTLQTGLVIWQHYLFAFMDEKIDYLPMNFGGTSNPSENWVYGWEDITPSRQGHRALATTDNAVYFCNGSALGSILVVAGESFDPTDTTTYTINLVALALPDFDLATCIAQLGVNLLVGGIQAYIYPWNRVSTSFNYPLIVPENYTKCIVSTNSSAYIFCGIRGYIYITNGSNIDIYKKIPDSLSNTVDPYFTWGWAIYLKNQLFFSFSGTNNSSTTIDNFAGIWAIDLNTQAFRMSNSLSYGTYAGSVPVLVQMGQIRPTGDGIYAGWLNDTGGVDYTSGNPYSNYESIIDTDLMNIGTFLNPNTFSNVEFKLGKPMVSGEGVKISWRSNLTDSFTLIGESTTAGLLSDLFTNNFQGVQWLQLRIQTKSTATAPTYTLLREVLIRN